MEKKKRYLPTLLASSSAGCLARIPCHPLDTIKARLQTFNSPFRYTSIYSGFKQILRTEGIRGLYRGIGIAFFGSIPAGCIYFTSYEIARDNLLSNYSNKSQFQIFFFSGMVAETLACVLYVPIDVIKERMQIQKHNKTANNIVYYKNSVDAIKKIVKTEGFIGFYKGYFATIFSYGPFTAFYFAFYEGLKKKTKSYFNNSQELPFLLTVFCSSVAGGAASFVTNPLDLVKLRLQVQRLTPGKEYSSIFDGLYKLWKYEGFTGMFKGVKARMAFHSLNTAVLMTLYEELKVFFNTE